jgi:hypothetical protein
MLNITVFTADTYLAGTLKQTGPGLKLPGKFRSPGSTDAQRRVKIVAPEKNRMKNG